MLRRCDHWMIEYSTGEIIRWTRNHKIQLLQNLERLKHIYDKEMKEEAARMRPITVFFQVIPRTAEQPYEQRNASGVTKWKTFSTLRDVQFV